MGSREAERQSSGGAIAERDELDASFRFFSPPARLRPFVDHLYCSRVGRRFGDEVDARRLPEAEAQLVFVIEEGSSLPSGQWLGGGLRASLFVQPAHLEFIEIPCTVREAVGVAFRPAGLRLLFPRGVGDLSDVRLVPLEQIWGAEARTLLLRLAAESSPRARLRLLQDCLSKRAQSAPPPNRVVARAAELMRAARGEISSEELARACGCTSRTLRSAAVAEAGLSPKQLGRIVRVRYALELLAEANVSLSRAAVESAFSDQAHMSREFRDLLGASPARLSERLDAPRRFKFSAERNLRSTGLLVMQRVDATAP